jgi:hypothetical protein
MRLNEFIQWVVENKKIVFIVIAILVLFSTVLGFILGTVKRKSVLPQYSSTEVEQSLSEYSEILRDTLLLPDPALPPVSDPFPPFSFYLERTASSKEEMEALPVRVSELIRNRNIGVEIEIQPFIYQNEEHDVLMKQDQLSEP